MVVSVCHRLYFQHLGGRGRRISVSLRPPGLQGLVREQVAKLQRNPVSTKQTNKKFSRGGDEMRSNTRIPNSWTALDFSRAALEAGSPTAEQLSRHCEGRLFSPAVLCCEVKAEQTLPHTLPRTNLLLRKALEDEFYHNLENKSRKRKF